MGDILDDIFDNDELGLLNERPAKHAIKTDDDRLRESFEEINLFYEHNQREPYSTNMAEFSLLARLKGFRADEVKKKILKPFDRFDLLGHLQTESKSVNDILAEDPLGLLDDTGDTSIFNFKHAPKPGSRAATDFNAQRKPMKELEFQPYEAGFQRVHQELKSGRRKLLSFDRLENNLQVGNYYLLDGLLLLLEFANIQQELRGVNTGGRVQLDGRTLTIFENGTKSNMLFRSLGKALQKGGKIVTQTLEDTEINLRANASVDPENDTASGWIYILRSRSRDPQIKSETDLYKIGFSTIDVNSRVRNASRESTYLYAEVEVIATYRCFNVNPRQLENLLHRFFGDCCLQVDILHSNGLQINPREWFIVPLPVIDQTIILILNGNIVNYRYDIHEKRLKLV